jgi:hypothetical protein
MKRGFAIGLLCALLGAASISGAVAKELQPGVRTQDVGQPLARFSLLKPSTRIYLRYKIVGDRRETLDMWRRQVSFETQDGQRRLHIVWRWDGVADPKFSRTENFWFETETFRPLTLERRLEKDGKITARSYRFLPDRIESIKDPSNADQKEFLQLAKMPAYNWETDMEFFQALPLAAGYDVRIPFYEAGPGQDAPQYYEYKVIGEDRIASTDGHTIECWVVGTESSDPQWGPTRLWFAKGTQILLREETKLKDGTLFVKILVPFDAGNEESWNRDLGQRNPA